MSDNDTTEMYREFVPNLQYFKNPCIFHSGFPEKEEIYNTGTKIFFVILAAPIILPIAIIGSPFLGGYIAYLAYKEKKYKKEHPNWEEERENERREMHEKISKEREKLMENPENVFYCPNCKKNKLKDFETFKRFKSYHPGWEPEFKNNEFRLK